jgi:hypothetical protein
MRRTALATLLILPACGEDHDPTPTGSTQPASDPSLPESGGGTVTTKVSLSDSAEVSSVPSSGFDSTDTAEPGSSTSEATTGETGETGVLLLSWESDIYPAIIAPNCGCHVDGAGGFRMGPDAETAYAATYLIPTLTAPTFYVVPNSAAMSYLYAKIAGTHLEIGGTSSQMPLGSSPLPPDDIELLGQWIDEGAAY